MCLPKILRRMKSVTVKEDIKVGAGKKTINDMLRSNAYRLLLERVRAGAVTIDTAGKELYAGVCGLGNICAVTDMTHLLTCILRGRLLKWDQPYRSALPAQVGDLMGFIFGIGHPLQG